MIVRLDLIAPPQRLFWSHFERVQFYSVRNPIKLDHLFSVRLRPQEWAEGSSGFATIIYWWIPLPRLAGLGVCSSTSNVRCCKLNKSSSNSKCIVVNLRIMTIRITTADRAFPNFCHIDLEISGRLWILRRFWDFGPESWSIPIQMGLINWDYLDHRSRCRAQEHQANSFLSESTECKSNACAWSFRMS